MNYYRSNIGSNETYLQYRTLSLKGGFALAAVTVLMLPILDASSGFSGWEWLPALVHAPT
ncbi:MAG: hypothetical protein WBV22_02865 [Anaerolineaceae bacterium]